MPGPASWAITSIPSRPLAPRTTRSITSPSPAYAVMLRATSEIAVASSVRSVELKPRSPPIARARCRAVTTSASVVIATRKGSLTVVGLLGDRLEERQPLFEIQRRVDVLELHPQLDHGEGDLGLDP